MSKFAMACLGLVGLGLTGIVNDAAGQQVTLVSVSTTGGGGSGFSYGPVLSGDGNCVGFTSGADNLVDGDNNHTYDVFVRDLTAQTTTRVSVTTDGQERTGYSGYLTVFGGHLATGVQVSLNQDGSMVAFTSASAFDAGDTNAMTDIYVRNRTLNQTTRVSVASDNSQSNGVSGDPQISANGRYVLLLPTPPISSQATPTASKTSSCAIAPRSRLRV